MHAGPLPLFIPPRISHWTPFYIDRVSTIGPTDHLSVPPVVYNTDNVRKRARRVAVETKFKDVEDAQSQTISPYISFCISQKEHSFTILHGDALAHIPGHPIHQAPLITHYVEPELLHGCYWSLNAIPYMGFLPVNPYRVCFNDSLFACVFQRKWEVPIHHDASQWQVAPQLAEQWLQLEHILVFLRDLLSVSIPVRSQEHLPAPLPSHYRFHRPHPDPLVLSQRLMRARYAFLLMGAEISFLYALQANPSSCRHSIDTALEGEAHRDVLVETILDSWLFVPANGYYPSRHSNGYAKEGCARYGMFVNAATSTLAHALVAYETFHVPVWIWWGNRLHTHTPKSAVIARRFGFNRDIVQRYLASLGASWDQLQSGRFFQRTIYKLPCQQRPHSKPIRIVSNDSSFAPLPDEPWFQFLSRRERCILACPPAQRDIQIINTRQLLAQSQGLVPHSAVFQWVRGPIGSLLRRRVPFHKAARVWGEFKPSHRIYCAAYDEWDLCEEFTSLDPPVHLAWQEPASSDPFEDESILSVEDRSSQLQVSQAVSDPFPEPSSPIPDVPDQHPVEIVAFVPLVDDIHDREQDRKMPPFPVPLDWSSICKSLYRADKSEIYMRTLRLLPTAIPILTDFYGITIPPDFLHVSDDSPSASDLHTLRKFLACSHPPPGHQTPLTAAAVAALTAFCQYITWYANGNGLSQQPPQSIVSTWSDFNESHPAFILRSGLPVKRIQWRVRPDPTYYFDWPTDPSLRLLLFRATDVLWFYRQHAKHPIERIVASMVSLGIRFSFAAVCTDSPLPPTQTRPLQPLPWRRTPFHANILEYHQYVARRARLFSSTSILRAALMAGGILWRLALEHVEDPGVLFDSYPTEALHLDVRSTDSTGVLIGEAGLTDDQVDIILGAYVLSAEYPPPPKSCHVSWFPKNFPSSGVDVGFWSEDAERWYQDRVHAYLTNKEQPCPGGHWHQRLRLYGAARSFSKGYDIVAGLKLDEAI